MSAFRVASCASQATAPSSGLRRLLGAARGMKIASATPVNDGKHVDIEFADATRYRFHTAWMKDSSPDNAGNDYYRKNAHSVFDVNAYVAAEAKASADGSKLVVEFRNGKKENTHSDEYVSSWLHAFAPYVGKPLHAEEAAQPQPVAGTGSLLDNLYKNRQGWKSDLDMPRFCPEKLRTCEDTQVQFMEAMVDPGVAIIDSIGPPKSMANEDVGTHFEQLVTEFLGRFNQHPVRGTRYGVMHNRAKVNKTANNADYDHKNPLSMHTDHTPYNGTPGYIQFMYQAKGNVQSKVCDGLALSELFRQTHPEEYKLLSTVQITHSSRNESYSKSGSYSMELSEVKDPFVFELVHTHPVIQLDKDGQLEKIVQSETKRGICALPYDVYDKFMAAYRLWTQHVENEQYVKVFPWPEHTMIAMNNYRILHGRAIVPPGMERCMVFGYVDKSRFQNRYRLLKQRQTERRNPEMTDKWLTRLPNQVLSNLVCSE